MTSRKIDVISDLHVDMNPSWEQNPAYQPGEPRIYPWHLEAQSDVLFVVGDTSNDPLTTLGVIEEAKGYYDLVLFTDGNHDHYVGNRIPQITVSETAKIFNAYCADNQTVRYLTVDQPEVHEGILYLGCMGWYDFMANRLMSFDQQRMYWLNGNSDASFIRFDPDQPPEVLAQIHAEYLRDQVEQAQNNSEIEGIVIGTHTIPHEKGGVPDTHPWGPLNGSFRNTLMEQVWLASGNEKISHWVFGHTHYNYDFDAEGIRFINNSRGYRNERKKTSIIQLDLDSPSEAIFPVE